MRILVLRLLISIGNLRAEPQNIRTDQPFAHFIILWNTEAALQHRLKIIYLEEGKIALPEIRSTSALVNQ